MLGAHGSGRDSPPVPYHPHLGQPLYPGLGDIDVPDGAGAGAGIVLEQSPVFGTFISKQILHGPLHSYYHGRLKNIKSCWLHLPSSSGDN